MKIETKFFGVQEINEADIIYFAHGVPGFENYHKFLMSRYNNDLPFLVMQSVEKADLAFILIGLEEVVPGYSIELNDEVAAELKLEKPEDVRVIAIVNIPDDMAKSTVNLVAPVLINTKAKLGKQIILNNPAYGLKHPLFAPRRDNQMEPDKAATK